MVKRETEKESKGRRERRLLYSKNAEIKDGKRSERELQNSKEEDEEEVN